MPSRAGGAAGSTAAKEAAAAKLNTSAAPKPGGLNLGGLKKPANGAGGPLNQEALGTAVNKSVGALNIPGSKLGLGNVKGIVDNKDVDAAQEKREAATSGASVDMDALREMFAEVLESRLTQFAADLAQNLAQDVNNGLQGVEQRILVQVAGYLEQLGAAIGELVTGEASGEEAPAPEPEPPKQTAAKAGGPSRSRTPGAKAQTQAAQASEWPKELEAYVAEITGAVQASAGVSGDLIAEHFTPQIIEAGVAATPAQVLAYIKALDLLDEAGLAKGE